ncbi:MAG: deoxyribonuclease IV [Candidatus Fermentibacteraceae bacterium]
MLTGIHASAAGGLGACAARVSAMGIPTAQIFTSNPRRYCDGPVPDAEAEEFRKLSAGVVFISHCSYLINMASFRPDLHKRSSDALRAELARCSLLGIPLCVLHPGSATGQERGAAIERAADSIREVLEGCSPSTVLLLENTVGAGCSLCGDLSELRDLLRLIGLPGRTGACIDTAHAHGRGYELDSAKSAALFCGELHYIFGASLMAFHLNDSKVERGSGSDRHQRPGEGLIGIDALAEIEAFHGFSGLPAVLETPGDDGDRLAGLRRIRERFHALT